MLNSLIENPKSKIQNQYDALLVLSFGGPEGMDDVIPFLENVLRGRNVPQERLMEVAEHYYHFGGVSPINEQNRALIAALRKEMEERGMHLPVYWGNRNWHPFLKDTMNEMKADGIRRALAFVTSAYSSYSGCRQYLEDIEQAREAVGANAPHVDKLRAFYNHPGFVEPCAEHVRAALEQIPEARRTSSRIAFTAHSIPLSLARESDYQTQLEETCRLVAEHAGHDRWQIVFQSRSGAPHIPWLGPDICDHLRDLKREGALDVVIAPVGFISDHMEIIYDLDTEARRVASELGLNMIRAATVGTHPLFVKMICELILERTDRAPKRFLGNRGASQDVCKPDCCPGKK